MDDQEERKQSAIKGWILGLAVGAVILGALATAYQIGRNNAEGGTTTTEAQTAATDTTGATTPDETTATTPANDAGAELFASGCGSCHTLSAADTTGTTGPNLDDLQPDEETVAAAIANGGTGSGVMPTNIYSGQEAQQVAEYVSSSAGQ